MRKKKHQRLRAMCALNLEHCDGCHVSPRYSAYWQLVSQIVLTNKKVSFFSKLIFAPLIDVALQN